MFNFVFDLECTPPDTGHQAVTEGIYVLQDFDNNLVLLDESVKIDVVCDTVHELDLQPENIVIALQTEKVELDVE